MNTEEEKSLDKLREIFFAEKDDRLEDFEKELESIKFRLNNKDAKVEAYYPIVTDLLEHKIKDSEEEVARVLSPVLGKALKTQIDESKDDIIDALYPIMGETIKKTVAEAIKDVYNTLNEKIDKALRRGVFSKRVKSKISGVSANDLILQGAFPFSVNEIFLIHEKSGILISHVSSENSDSSDADLISGMLTAIKDFVRESFRTDDGAQNLYEIQYGDSKIILERGLYSYLAIVVSGPEPPEFDTVLSEFNIEIHKKFSKKLNNFDGNVFKLKGVEKYLKSFVAEFIYSEDAPEEKPKPILGYLLLGIILLSLIIWGAFKIPQYFKDKTIEDQLTEKLLDIDGLNVDAIKLYSEDNTLYLEGMVKNYREKAIVDSVIATIPKISNVDDKLGVLFFQSKANIIGQNIDQILLINNFKEISYLIEKDKVTLNGLINSYKDKVVVSDKISNIDGVRIVINNLQVNNITELVKNIVLNFEHQKVYLSKEHHAKLDELYRILHTDGYSIRIIGIADGRYSEGNMNVANLRAENAKKYLVARGFNENDITTFGIIENERAIRFEIIGVTKNEY